MKDSRRFSVSSVITVSLVAVVMFGGTALAAAQSDSAVRSAPSTVTFKTLVNFDGTNGAYPSRSPIQGIDGNLYGGTEAGGQYSHGTLYRMTPAGTLTTLYSFCETSGCPDGSGGDLSALGADGTFYGSSGSGGASGHGTLFKFTKAGAFTMLDSFDNTDGGGGAGLVQLSSGDFYGTTPYGGDLSECSGSGCGSVFKMTSAGTLTTLYDFCSKSGCADGAVVYDALTQGTDGNFYGTTWGGGPADGGTVFKITPAGTLTTLYSFCVIHYPFCEGSNPISLVLGADGNFYGTTASGGNNYSAGTVFKITPTGTLTTIYNFCAQTACADGSTPRDGLVLGSDGNFYGPTYYGGTYNEGTLFQITPAGTLTTLYSFDSTHGYYPIQHLFQATNGTFYGTTDSGGSGGVGVIFSLSVGLGPFVETAPISGKVGTKVIILGNKLTGSTKVTFNGTAAVFKVVSGTEIMTTVPSGATTGPVKVTTPSGTLTSKVNFQVP